MVKSKTKMSNKSYASQDNNEATEVYEIDSELLDVKYNQVRKPSLPYGIIINDQPAGIFIPTDQFIKAEWLEIPREEQLTTVELTKEITGLLIEKTRMLVLAFLPEYIRYKPSEENGEQAGNFIGLYDDYRDSLNKKTMDVCSEHALIFLDTKNKPLHKVPIVVRFKNVSLWSFKSTREEFYRTLEKVFYDYCKQQGLEVEYSGKNDKWRSLGVLNIEFKAIREGEGKNKSYCCKTYKLTKPTSANLSKLFLGQPKKKQQIWGFHDNIAGFIEAGESQLPALAADAEPEVSALPPQKNGKQLRKITQVEEELDEELDELDEFGTDSELEEFEDFDKDL
ncbi:MAG: hypothetical protein F6K58_12955 [Symploca sp. SIO2E9]|nr:hypothetical protein [Symploca sp. SIO2E9]